MPGPEPSLLLHTHFRRQAAETPDRIALQDGGATVEYEELAYRVACLAGELRSGGVGPGGYVGLHLERSIDSILATLAILDLGAAVVPLPPSYPEARRREILDFSGLDAVIDGPSTPIGALYRGPVFRAEAASGEALTEPELVSPDRPAFVLCSSGSTGTPKMIVRSHRSFFHRLHWTWGQLPFQPDERCCQKSHMTTTHAIYELFEPLLAGVPVTVIGDAELRNLEGFWNTIRAEAVTRLLIVPSLLRVSLEMPGFAAPPLRTLTLMGEAVDGPLADLAVAAFAATPSIVSIYGSTEASSTHVADLRAPPGRPARRPPLASPSTPRSRLSSSTMRFDRSPTATPGCSTSPALRSSPNTSRTPPGRRRPMRTARTGAAAIGRTISYAEARMEASTSWVGPATPSRFAASVSTSVKSRRRSPRRRGYATPQRCRSRTVWWHSSRPPASRRPRSPAPSRIGSRRRWSLQRSWRSTSFLARRTARSIDAALLPTGRPARRPPTPCSPPTPNDESPPSGGRSLGPAAIAPSTEFFEQAHLATVFAVVHRLRAAFGLTQEQLTELSVYRHPTVEALARHLGELARGAPQRADVSAGLVVSLKATADPALDPVFLIAPAGGALGPYDKLVAQLSGPRQVLGIRDPFLWGGRDPSTGFGGWIDCYLAAIRDRQPAGPYRIVAYSSAGAFGYEIARRLRQEGAEVARLILIDPVGIDSASLLRYGYWALRSQALPPILARVLLAGGHLRAFIPAGLRERARRPGESRPAPAAFARFADGVRRDRGHLRRLLSSSS